MSRPAPCGAPPVPQVHRSRSRTRCTSREAGARAGELSVRSGHGGLAAAGFIDVVVVEHPEWLERELAMWREAAELDPGDDPALRALRDDGVEVLADADSGRRFIASATA